MVFGDFQEAVNEDVNIVQHAFAWGGEALVYGGYGEPTAGLEDYELEGIPEKTELDSWDITFVFKVEDQTDDLIDRVAASIELLLRDEQFSKGRWNMVHLGDIIAEGSKGQFLTFSVYLGDYIDESMQPMPKGFIQEVAQKLDQMRHQSR